MCGTAKSAVSPWLVKNLRQSIVKSAGLGTAHTAYKTDPTEMRCRFCLNNH